MDLFVRKALTEEPINRYGDLNDDCFARWAGLLLRAEWMNKDYWWWCVYDMTIPDETQVDSSNEYKEKATDGEMAGKRAEEAAVTYLKFINVLK